MPDGENLLDRTAVHPESYRAAETLLLLCGYTAADAAAGKLSELRSRLDALGHADAAARCGVGVPTLLDIAADVLEIKDLTEGMELTGTVRNVTDFGAFVDIGVHQDGLVHISEISRRFIRHPSEAVTLGDVVRVRVLSVSQKSGRISLSMKQTEKA